MKKNKPNGIPLKTLFLSPSFQRNFEIFMSEDPSDTELYRAIMTELFSNASQNVMSEQKHHEASSKGGAETAKVTTDALAPRNKEIVEQAVKLLKNGRGRRDLASILAKKHNLSARRVRDILKKNDI